jgi:hypothetical protein
MCDIYVENLFFRCCSMPVFILWHRVDVSDIITVSVFKVETVRSSKISPVQPTYTMFHHSKTGITQVKIIYLTL